MNQLDRLAGRLRKTPMLIVDGDNDQAALLTRNEASLRSLDAEDGSPAIVCNVEKSLRRFRQAIPDENVKIGPSLVAKSSGLSYSQTDEWLRAGLIVASVRPADGTIRERLFSMGDTFLTCLLADLRRRGTGLPLLRKVAAAVREAMEEASEELQLEAVN